MAKNQLDFDELISELKSGVHPSAYSVSLSSIAPTDEEVEEFVDTVIEEDIPIRSVSLDHKGAGVRTAKAFARLIDARPGLRHIYLCKAQIGEEGARILAEAAKNSPGMRWLSLNDTDIGDEGVKHVIDAAQAGGLTNIYFRGVGMTDAGAAYLAEKLPTIDTLRLVNYSHNPVSPEAGMEVFRALKQNQGLVLLSLQTEKLNDEQKEEARDIILNHSSLSFNTVFADHVGTSGLGPEVNRQLSARDDAVKSLSDKLYLVDEDAPDALSLMQFQDYRYALEYEGKCKDFSAKLDAHVAQRPFAPVEETTSLEALLEKDPKTGFCRLDHPDTVRNLGEIMERFAPFNASQLLDRGEPNALLRTVVGAEKVCEVFAPQNWCGALGQMRTVYKAMPPEGQEQISDWPRLQSRAARSAPAEQRGV